MHRYLCSAVALCPVGLDVAHKRFQMLHSQQSVELALSRPYVVMSDRDDVLGKIKAIANQGADKLLVRDHLVRSEPHKMSCVHLYLRGFTREAPG